MEQSKKIQLETIRRFNDMESTMRRHIWKMRLLQEARDRVELVPRWRIFKRKWMREIERATILMIAGMDDSKPST